MRSARAILLLAALASGAMCVGGAYLIARRAQRFHEENPRQQFAFLPIVERHFSFAGRPVSLLDDPASPESPWIELRYGEASQRIRVSIPPKHRLPGLLRHDQWLRVALFAPVSGITVEQFKEGVADGTIQSRLAVVTRSVAPGTDPLTTGAIDKKGWTFDFYELTPDGAIEHQHLKYPTTRGNKPPKPGELQENTWQFQAALMLMPQVGGVGPTRNFFGDALSAAGWLLPLSAFSGLACTVSLTFAFATGRRRARAGDSPSRA
jgi:hypothetical protein